MEKHTKLAFYHPNTKGTGCAIAFELNPATAEYEGFIRCSFANQMTIGNPRGGNPIYPKFDWENDVVVRLGFDDLCKMLQVFRGECESINDGKGLFHGTGKCTNMIQLRHIIDPVCGYKFSVSHIERDARTSGETRSTILLSNSEALGLCEAITGSLYLIAFGNV